MCTVTAIRVNGQILITSSRDEQPSRPAAFAPVKYHLRTGNVLFPKDAAANGTWIAVHENGNVAVLLNGGWKKHLSEPPYRKSRGLVLLDVIDHAGPLQQFLALDLEQIEPFTIILLQEGELFECRWTGKEKTNRRLSLRTPRIWSSVTLYDDQETGKRESRFYDWLEKNPAPELQDAIDFHLDVYADDRKNGIALHRNGALLTVSLTAIAISKRTARMLYHDLKSDKRAVEQLELLSKTLQRS